MTRTKCSDIASTSGTTSTAGRVEVPFRDVRVGAFLTGSWSKIQLGEIAVLARDSNTELGGVGAGWPDGQMSRQMRSSRGQCVTRAGWLFGLSPRMSQPLARFRQRASW